MKKVLCCLGIVLIAGIGKASSEPVVELSVSVSQWLNYYSEAGETNKAIDNLVTLGISNIAFSVAIEEGHVVSFAKVDTSLPDARATWLSHTNLIQLESVSADEFKWIPSPGKKPTTLNPLENIHVRFSGNTVLFADETHFSDAESLNTTVEHQSLVRGSIRLPLLLKPLVDAADKMISEQEEGFGKAMMSGMLKSLIGYTTSLQEIAVVSIDITPLNPETRKMSLTLEYENPESARKTKAFFDDSSEAWKNPEVTKMQLGLAGLLDSPNFKEVSLTENKLGFVYQWVAADDGVMLKTIGSSVMGSLFSFGDSSSYPIHTEQTITSPVLGSIDSFSADQLEAEFKSALFLNNVWKHQVDFIVDYLDLPNIDLLQTSISNICVFGTNGLNMADQKKQGRFSYDEKEKSASIRLPIDQNAGDPVSASFTLNLTFPTEIERYTLTEQIPLMEKGNKGCCLVTLSNSVVSLRSKGISLREAKIYALNKEGQYLGHKGASWSDSNFRAEYRGLPVTVEVVLPIETQSVSFDFKDRAAGKADKLKMPSTATNNVVSRYTQQPLKMFVEPDLSMITAGSMSYVTNGGWQKNKYQLKFPKPDDVEIELISTKVYLTGVDEFVVLSGKKGWSSSGNQFEWQLENTNLLDRATAIIGEFDGSFWSGIGSYSTTVSTNFTPLIPGSELPAAAVEQNVVWIDSSSEGRVLDIQAFDETERQLKKDFRTSMTGSKKGYFFWGRPQRVSVIYASSKEQVSVPFEIELKAKGSEAVSALQEKVVAFEAMLEQVQSVGKKASARYGCLLAAQYYGYNSRKAPREAIPLEIAHSDPAGMEIFGYKVKPFKGYFFQKILTDQEVKSAREKKTYRWQGGEFEAVPDRGVLLVKPADAKMPAFLVTWGRVYLSYKDCSEMTQISMKSDDLKKDGWIQIQ
jgi:hypothetical protein